MNEVTITITNRTTGERYKAKSYPDSDRDNDGKIDYYYVPVFVTTISSESRTKSWKALRFMPFWNDPLAPSDQYKTKGFLTSGLHRYRRKAVSKYKATYGIHNRFSPYKGAIVIRDTFYIHAGPSHIGASGWGAAGCVEIIGNFDKFKQDIRDLGGISNSVEAGAAIADMVRKGKLYVEVKYAAPPTLSKIEVTKP